MKPFITKRKKGSVAIAAIFACVVAGVLFLPIRKSPMDYPLAMESDLEVLLIQHGNTHRLVMKNISNRTVCVDRNLQYGFVIGSPSPHEWIMSQEFSERLISFREMISVTDFVRLKPDQSIKSRLDPLSIHKSIFVYRHVNAEEGRLKNGHRSYIVHYLQRREQNGAGSAVDLHYAPRQNHFDLLWANADHPEKTPRRNGLPTPIMRPIPILFI